MKKKFFLVLGIILLVLILSFFYIYRNDNLRFKFEYELYNNISYTNGKKIKTDIDVDNNVVYVKEEDVFDVLTSGDSVIYFGYSTCPWCRNMVSLLVDVVKENNVDKLYYVDVENVDTSTKEIVNTLDEYLMLDKSGNKRLFVPDVYFVHDGKIVFHHLGTVDSYKNAYKGMSDDEKNSLKEIYQEGIDLIKGEEK